MIALKAVDVKRDFKTVCMQVNDGVTVLVPRPHNENIVLISERRLNELEYLEKLERSRQESAAGLTVTKTLEELEAFE